MPHMLIKMHNDEIHNIMETMKLRGVHFNWLIKK